MEISLSKLQEKPALLKQVKMADLIDKRAKKEIGLFISADYRDIINMVKKEISKKERLIAIKKIKDYDNDISFLEEGVNDALE